MDWVTPTLGLVGVVGASSIAYAQFRRTERNKTRTQFESARTQTLEKLLSALTELELWAREVFTRSLTLEERQEFLAAVPEHKRHVNELLIRHRDTLGREDAQAARDFVDAVEYLSIVLATAPPPDREAVATTDAGGFISQELARAFVKLTDSHEYLAKQLRKSQGGPDKL
jgi:hypothetical protein